MKTKDIKIRTIIALMASIIFITSISQAQDEKRLSDDEQDQKHYKIMPAQLTFIYPMGTNGVQAVNTINYVSLNMLAGISAGVRGVELGGLANVSKGDVMGLQAAGLVNTSLGHAKGMQMAGLVNFNKGSVQGVQSAGLVNLTTQSMEGLQLAGLVNVNTKELTGIQGAGLVNVTTQSLEGLQIAGLVNVNTKNVTGVQAAGLINTTTGNVSGLQTSGIANVVTSEMSGAQIGLMNFSRTLNGFQLGLVNVADSVGKGAGLGLITFYRNGYHAFEVEFNETFRANATFKSGVEKLYMIYTVGIKTDNGKTYWSPGIGVGSNFHLSENLNMNTDLISRQVNEDKWWTEDLNMLNTLKVNLAWNISDKVAFYGGPSYNIVISGIEDNEGNVIGDSFSPWAFYDKTYTNNRLKMYFGFNAGLRF